MSGQEKKAEMSAAERNKIIKAMLLAGGASALIGAMSRKAKSKERRKKSMDPEASSNAIIVPISKRDFVRDLPTPKELAESRGEIAPKPLAKEIAYEAPKENVEIAKDPVAAASATPTFITLEDLKARKKEILRGRKFDFFGGQRTKAAEDGGEAKKEDDKTSDAKKNSENKDNDRVILRSPDGRFASPTDPVAVEQVEKDAGWPALSYIFGGLSSALSPVDTIKKIWDVATDKPLWTAGGALGSVYIAEKISEAINKRRREKSKARLEKARDKYVSLMEGGDGTEKSAEDDPNPFQKYTGLALGTAFFIPAALTALITNRIHENRKADKKKLKEMSDSYPQDPYILYKVIDGPGEEKVAEAHDMPTVMYKTAEGKDIEIGADTALMMIFLKEAMFEAAERAEIEASMEKSAQGMMSPSYQAHKDQLAGDSDEDINKGVNDLVDIMLKDDNKGALLDMIKDIQANGDKSDYKGGVKKMLPWTSKLGNLFGVGDAARFERLSKDPRFMARLAQNEKLQEGMIQNFGSDKNYIDFKNKMINDRIGSWLARNGFNKGGILHQIISWLAQNLGIGGMIFNSNLKDKLGEISDKNMGIIAKNQRKAQELEAKKRQAEAAKAPSYVSYLYDVLPDHIQKGIAEGMGVNAAVPAAENSASLATDAQPAPNATPAQPTAGKTQPIVPDYAVPQPAKTNVVAAQGVPVQKQVQESNQETRTTASVAQPATGVSRNAVPASATPNAAASKDDDFFKKDPLDQKTWTDEWGK